MSHPGKRIVICCDGTWNLLDAREPTNVVATASAVAAVAEDGRQQIVHYDDGVGAAAPTHVRLLDKVAGGVFGAGLVAKIERAYRFLVFNYAPGDELYIFGFSRGAFTARSLAGLIRNCGIVARSDAGRSRQAIRRYRSRDRRHHPDAEDSLRFRAEHCPHLFLNDRELNWREAQGLPVDGLTRLSIRYLGVWDTVGALGIPKYYWAAGLFNQRFRFHDLDLSSTVESARHAVALDERRRAYEPALWRNLTSLNRAAGAADGDAAAPYRQLWFPGEHASVGGGGDVIGLARAALGWIAEGAARQGLAFRPGAGADWAKQADHRVSLRPRSGSSWSGRLFDAIWVRRPRRGPRAAAALAEATLRRYHEPAANLAGGAYRPHSLRRLESPVPRPAAAPLHPTLSADG